MTRRRAARPFDSPSPPSRLPARPFVWYDAIEVDLPLVTPDVGPDGVEA